MFIVNRCYNHIWCFHCHQMLQSCTCSLSTDVTVTFDMFIVNRCYSHIWHVHCQQMLQSHLTCSLSTDVTVTFDMFIVNRCYSHIWHVHCQQMLQSHSYVVSKICSQSKLWFVVFRCELVNGTQLVEGDFRHLRNNAVPQSSDIVFIVEAKECNRNIKHKRNMDSLISLMLKELTDLKITSNR